MHLDLRKKTGDKFTADEFNQIISAINAKVEQEAGKALSDENFTAEEKQFLATLAAKDIVKMITDEITRATEAEGTLSSSISKLSKDFTDFISDTADADNVINRFHEIVAFLSGIAETDTLEGMLSEMSSSVSQSITTAISDFEVKIKLFISQNYQPKESGKGLSTNDYTTTEKEKLAGLPTGTQITQNLASKVDKVEGKQLSTEDFTTALKNKLEGLSNYNDTEVKKSLASLQSTINTLVNENPNEVIDSFNEVKKFLEGVTDTENLAAMLAALESKITAKIPTKLSQLNNDGNFVSDKNYVHTDNNFTTAEKEKLAGLPTGTQITQNLASKVDKVEGKQLSTEDFTTALKNKLEGLSNYNDTEVKKSLASLQSTINTLVNENPNEVIDSFNEVKKFLEGVTDTENLAAMLAALESKITAKIPTKLSQLNNDGNFVSDKNYVHTDNNFTTAEKEKLAGLANYDDTTITKSINDEITRSKAAESALSGKLDELSKVALADVGYFAIEYGDEEDSSQADPAVTIINQPYYDYFMAKWEAANKPCEKKLDGTDFAYLQDDVTLRADDSASHLEDANYFQGAEMINFNISYFYDAINKKSRVFFNLDKEAPCGYHRFIPYESILMPRYNQYVEGGKIKTCSNYQVINNQSVQDFCNVLSATSADMLGYTWWQNVCLAWLAVAKYQTRDIQANLPGMTTGQDTYGRFKNGLLDSKHQATGQWTVTATRYSNTVAGEVASENFEFKPYKLWWCENLLHGDAWIRCFGGITKLVDGKRYLYFTRDPEVASVKATVDANDATKFEDKVEVARNLTEGSYIKKINGMYPVPLVNNGSSTTCFCDGQWGCNTQGDNNIPFVGATASDAALCGLFALSLYRAVSSRGVNYRVRATLKK